ncbi:translocon-associated protein subunit alpha [Anaeramoeba flamelloides]|uniref:Translocon-associated protein subunit alpha n=1 Tax=Anaeramoeba flamelloides TaxID=1746091 RepID=A0AAV8AG12_9EUKA|nr:translocon-associated protein subunit alpha [Anaeramoeba flamelloides]KAJ6237139.1 translocon-associated protein subunit alpha [Anaeramoeba flamelloides]
MKIKSILYLTFVFCILFSFIRCEKEDQEDKEPKNIEIEDEQEDDNDEEELIFVEDDNLEMEAQPALTASEFVETKFVVPSYPDLQIKIPTNLKILAGLTNKGKTTYYLQRIGGSIRYPQDYSKVITNVTETDFRGIKLEPGQQIALPYYLYLSEAWQPRTYTLVLEAYYAEQDPVLVNYTSTFFNTTIELLESGSSFDATMIFTYVAILAGAVFGGVQFYNWKYASGKSGSSTKKPTIKTQTKNNKKQTNKNIKKSSSGNLSDFVDSRHLSKSPKTGKKNQGKKGKKK